MQASPPTRRRFIGTPFGFILLAWMVIVVGLAVMIGATGSLPYKDWTTEAFFFWRQDVPIVVVCLGVTVLLALIPAAWLARAAWRPRLPQRTLILLLTAVCLVAGGLGVGLVFGDYSFSLDEFLANFDAQIFASGRLIAPVAPAWSDYTSSLQPMYMLPLPDNVWASSYLPVNAGLRAVGRLAHAEGLVNPLLSAFSVVAVYGIGRRLWPERPEVAPIAAVLLGTSAQLIVMSMTAYAMPAHLAFNLAWLWLFLRGGRLGHSGAIAVGFLGTGLHQLLFHPVFVAPFILQLWFRRRWGLASLYTFAYGAIVLFWVEYWPLASLVSGVSASGDGSSTGGAFLYDRISDVLDKIYWRNIGVMAECLTRFVSWQNLLTAPLFLVGVLWSVRTKGPLRPLVFGVFLTLIAVGVATPTQTHGWGYRYLHGLLGSICLVAAWSWSRLTQALPPEKRAAALGGLAVACAVSLLVLTPIRALQAWAYVRPYAAANAAVQSAKTDVVMVDHNSQVLFDMGTLVRNDPLLVHTPKVMAQSDTDEDTMRELCEEHSVLVFNGDNARAYGIDVIPWRNPIYIARRRAMMMQLGCYHPMPLPR